MGYSEQGQKLYDEALRTIPGIYGAKDRRDSTGVKVLLDGYFETARCLGLKQKDAWQVLFNASIHWGTRLLDRYADSQGVEDTEIIQRMGALAALWRSDAADPS